MNFVASVSTSLFLSQVVIFEFYCSPDWYSDKLLAIAWFLELTGLCGFGKILVVLFQRESLDLSFTAQILCSMDKFSFGILVKF